MGGWYIYSLNRHHYPGGRSLLWCLFYSYTGRYLLDIYWFSGKVCCSGVLHTPNLIALNSVLTPLLHKAGFVSSSEEWEWAVSFPDQTRWDSRDHITGTTWYGVSCISSWMLCQGFLINHFLVVKWVTVHKFIQHPVQLLTQLFRRKLK